MQARLLLAVATAALAASLVVPSVTAQEVGITNPETPTPTTLYFHINGFQDFAINTQKPEDKYSETAGVGLATNSLTCIPNPPAGGSPFVDYHKYYGYSSPSYVEYNFEENGRPRTHPERGISYDAVIDQGTPFFLYWYLATQTGAPSASGPADPDSAPVIVPNMKMVATIRAGDAISVDDKAYDRGEPLATGSTNPVTIGGGYIIDPTGSAPAGTTNGQVTYMGQVSGKYVYEFKVPMTVSNPVIPRATGYNIRIDIQTDAQAACLQPEGKLMPNLVKVHTSPQFRPRMELAINDPIRLEYLHPQFVGDDLVIHTSMNSAWGNYDVNEQDPDGIAVAITGPSPATSLAKAAIVQRTHEHYHHQEAVDITYVWPYKTDRAANGLYTVEVKFMNDQRTATATGIAQFEIGKGTVIGCGGVQEAAEAINDDCASQVQKDGKAASKDSPGLELLGILAILGAALVVVRRRNQ
jgi:hypothetical protein